MVWIKTIDFPDGTGRGHPAGMDTNVYALQMLAAERLTHARSEARRLDLVAQARRARPSRRARLGASLIALGEWLRGAPALAAASPS